MAITYGLHPNKILKDNRIYRALIEKRQKYTIDDVTTPMVRQSPGLTDAAGRGTLKFFMEEVSGVLEEGSSVTTLLFKAQCNIGGKFTGLDDYCQSNRHQVKVNLTPGAMFKEIAGQVRPHKTGSNLPRPIVEAFMDMSPGSSNSRLIPDGRPSSKGPA